MLVRDALDRQAELDCLIPAADDAGVLGVVGIGIRDWPRLILRPTAAAYCGLDPAQFTMGVKRGILPAPLMFADADRWSRMDIDRRRTDGQLKPLWGFLKAAQRPIVNWNRR